MKKVKVFQKGSPILGIFGILLLTVLWWQWGTHQQAFFEPDRLFHFAYWRSLVFQNCFLLREWAQFPALGWDNFFSDKEFLYHWLLQFPFRWGGENTVLFFQYFFSASIIFIPLILNFKNKILALGIQLSFLIHPIWILRFSLLRAHVFAWLLFLFALWLISSSEKKRSTLGIGVFLFLFQLSYHAFYLPIFLLLYLGLFSKIWHVVDKENIFFRTRELLVLFAFALAGMILHPYFPSNIIRGIQHLALALRGQQMQAVFSLGEELAPIGFQEYFQLYVGYILFIFAGLFLIRKQRVFASAFNLCLAAIFWILVLLSHRLVEIAIPCTAMAFYFLLKDQKRKMKITFILMMLFFQGIQFYMAEKNNWLKNTSVPSKESVSQILKKIPDSRATIFHCDWPMGSYIVYENQNFSAVDALDPTFLYLAAQEKFFLREQLVKGNYENPLEELKKFHADYVLCRASPLVMQLLKLENQGVRLVAANRSTNLLLFSLPK